MSEWYLLYTKPHKERRVSEVLEAQGIETYVPVARARGRHGAWVLRAFFPCYLFARVDLMTLGMSAIQWTPGLVRVVGYGGAPSPVPVAIVQHIRDRLVELRERGWPQFRPGQRLAVKSGPFKDLEAVFERQLPESHRAQVLIDILGRLTSCELDLAELEAA